MSSAVASEKLRACIFVARIYIYNREKAMRMLSLKKYNPNLRVIFHVIVFEDKLIKLLSP